MKDSPPPGDGLPPRIPAGAARDPFAIQGTGAASPDPGHAEPEPPAPPPPASTDPPDPDRFVAVLKAATLLAFLGIATAGVLRIDQRVRSLDDFQVDLSRARVEAPAWLPPKEVAEIRMRAAAGGKVPIRQEGLPEFVAGRLESDPRIARVLGARRVHPDAVEVMVELRHPVALVETGSVLAAVDREGRRVPGDYTKRPLPRIRGGGGSLPAEGESFGQAIVDGASVAAALPGELTSSLGLAVLDVSGVSKGGGVVLRRKTGPGVAPLSVEWGRAPAAEDAALDPPAAAKVDRLRLAATRFPGLKGLKSVRLGFDDLVVVPL